MTHSNMVTNILTFFGDKIAILQEVPRSNLSLELIKGRNLIGNSLLDQNPKMCAFSLWLYIEFK